MTRNEEFNGQRNFPVAGRYFELLSTVNAVDVRFYDSDDNVISEEKQVEEGFFVDRRGIKADENGKLVALKPFSRFEITTGALERVKFIVTDGYSGQRSALADVTDRAARLLGIVYGTLGQVAQELLNGVNALVVACKGTLGTLAQLAVGGVNALQVTQRGQAYGASVVDQSAPAANTAVTLVAAASNTGGMIVWHSSFVVKCAQTAWGGVILAKTSAPTGPTDGDVIVGPSMSAGADSGGGGISTYGGHIQMPVFIAAGKGLYFITGGNTQATVSCARYTLL